MQNARMLLVVALMMGVGRIAGGDDRHAGHEDEQAAQQRARRDQLHAAVQKICPISGEKLGSMGPPIKITVGEHKEQVFVCCKGCLKGKIDAQHWTTIHANFAKAQGICPVMKHELPKNPKWTIVEGQVVYVCCPPCTKKIAADPAMYLPKIDELYMASLRSRQEQARAGQPTRR